MITWIYRLLLFVLLFGVNALVYGGNQGSPILNAMINGSALIGIPALVLCYFQFPSLYKFVAWCLLLSVVLLILESKYEYNEFMYSFFVIKRLVYCGLALSAFYIMGKVKTIKFEYVVYFIFGFYFINQILMGRIFSYDLTSESRTTSAFEAFYLVIPFLYYLVCYLKQHRSIHLVLALFSFALIVFLLHRSVITTVVIGAIFVFGLSILGKLSTNGLPLGRTVGVFAVLLMIMIPLAGLLPGNKVKSLVENISGIFDPKEDETGSWRVEQSTYYLTKIPERPLFGWRYEGYDRGEIMDNEDFPEKGTFIHSQYIDMLYNYGAVGLAINLILILGTLISMYVRNRSFTTEQAVLFGFIASGLVFGISYQLPIYYWSFVGVGMFYGQRRSTHTYSINYSPLQTEPGASRQPFVVAENQSSL